jgi:hypothetical protein
MSVSPAPSTPTEHSWTEFAGRGRFPAVCRHCRIREDNPAAGQPCSGEREGVAAPTDRACPCCHATPDECGYPDWICCPDCGHRPTANGAALLRRCDEIDAEDPDRYGWVDTDTIRALLRGDGRAAR